MLSSGQCLQDAAKCCPVPVAMAKASLQLWFHPSPKGGILERVRFFPRTGASALDSTRGDRFNITGRGYAWTKATKALALLLLRHHADPETAAIEGGSESPARTLFNLLEHPERSAAAVPFTEREGLCHLRSFLECTHVARGRHRIEVTRARLPPGALVVYIDGAEVSPFSTAVLRVGLAEAWPDWGRKSPDEIAPFEYDPGGFVENQRPVFGRAKLLSELDRIVAPGQITALTGAPGAGKTAAASHFLRDLAARPNASFRRIFAWTFQEDEDPRAGFEAFLRFLKVEGMPAGDYPLGACAARAAEGLPTLVVFDGVENLQTVVGRERGAFSDPALRGFLSAVSSGTGCLLVTRLAPLEGTVALVMEADPLPPQACREILVARGITGPDGDLDRAAELAAGCPLAAEILARHLNTAHHGRVRALAEETFWLVSAPGSAAKAHRIMVDHAAELHGTSALALLHLLSCFEQAPDFALLAEFVFHGPHLPRFTDRLPGLSSLRTDLNTLHCRGLIRIGSHLTLHPVAKQHFRRDFQTVAPDLHRAAHSWQYDRISKDSAIPEHPTELADYRALLAALHHARIAGRLAEAWREITWRRIMREGQNYRMTAELGEFQLCLRTWAAFWEVPFQKVHPTLPTEAHPIVTASAGFALFMTDRVEEAEHLLLRAMKRSFRRVRPDHAIQPAAVLGFIRTRQGRFAEARKLLRPIVSIARWIGPATRSPAHVLLTPACHLAVVYQEEGKLEKARRLFAFAAGRYDGRDGLELPPQMLVMRWETLIRSGDLSGFEASTPLFGQIDSVPLIYQLGILPFLKSLSAWQQWLDFREAVQLAEAEREAKLACQRTASSGYQLFHCRHLTHYAAVLNALHDSDGAGRALSVAAPLAQRYGLNGESRAINTLTGALPAS